MIVDIITIDTKIKCPGCQHAWEEKTPLRIDGLHETIIVRNWFSRQWFWWGPIVGFLLAAGIAWGMR